MVEQGSEKRTARSRQVPSVVHALRILDYLAHSSPEAGVTEIARALKINKSTCFNVLATLCASQVVIKHPKVALYRLGPKLIELGNATRRNLSSWIGIRDRVREMVDQLRLTCLIGQVFADGSGIVIVDRIVPARPGVSVLPVGHVIPMTGPAMGRAVLASREDAEALELARRLDLISSAGELAFLGQLQAIRDKGFSTSVGEYDPGVNAVAMVFGGLPGAELVLCVVGLKSHLPKSGLDTVGRRMRQTARSLDTYRTAGV